MSWAAELAEHAFANLPSFAREALWARGVSDEQIDLFQIGYLDRELPDGLPEAFVSWAKGGDKLDDVFVFPLTNTRGEIKGFQFRHVDRSRSGYMDYFSERREAVLFGLGQAVPAMWESGRVYLVEGAFDLLPIQRAFPAVVATLTARPSGHTIRVLRRLVNKIWMGYDMDTTGRNGCTQFREEYGGEFEVYIVSYPKVAGTVIKDPGDLWEAWGDDQMIPFVQSQVVENPYA